MTLDGWKAIARHLEAIGCPERDRVTLWRWTLWRDPLPIYATNGQRAGGRRIKAEADEVTAWWRRIVDNATTARSTGSGPDNARSCARGA